MLSSDPLHFLKQPEGSGEFQNKNFDLFYLTGSKFRRLTPNDKARYCEFVCSNFNQIGVEQLFYKTLHSYIFMSLADKEFEIHLDKEHQKLFLMQIPKLLKNENKRIESEFKKESVDRVKDSMHQEIAKMLTDSLINISSLEMSDKLSHSMLSRALFDQKDKYHLLTELAFQFPKIVSLLVKMHKRQCQSSNCKPVVLAMEQLNDLEKLADVAPRVRLLLGTIYSREMS